MKKCPGCGTGFVGFEKLCSVCRRSKSSKVSVALVNAAFDDYNKDALKGPVDRIVPNKLVPGEPCPCCGVKYRPRMSDAERQRRYRKRKNDHD